MTSVILSVSLRLMMVQCHGRPQDVKPERRGPGEQLNKPDVYTVGSRAWIE